MATGQTDAASFATAYGGNGLAGGSATAQATSSTTVDSGPTTATALAYGGPGQGFTKATFGTANATAGATGVGASGATATALAAGVSGQSTATSTSSGGYVARVIATASGTADIPVSGYTGTQGTTAIATTNVGGTVAAVVNGIGTANAYAAGTGAPPSLYVSQVLASQSSLATIFGSPGATVLGVASLAAESASMDRARASTTAA